MTSNDLIFQHVKSQLLPLSRWETILEKAVERLPRHLIPVKFNNLQDITVIDDQRGLYRSLSTTPHFSLDVSAFLPGGWFYLELAVVRNNGSREAALLLKSDQGLPYALPIPTNIRGTVREIFFLPPHTRALQWSPTADKGYFSQSPLLIHRISHLESILRRAYRVFFDYRRMPPNILRTESKAKIWHVYTRLQESYLQTADFRNKRLNGIDYAAYIAVTKEKMKYNYATLQGQLKKWTKRPRISLIMAVHNPQMAWLQEAIETCKAQLYPDREVIIAGDIAQIQKRKPTLIEQCKQTEFLRLVQVSSTDDLATILNAALAQSTGEYILQIGQHDKLSPEALLFAAQELQNSPDCALVYSDDDELDHVGARSTPRCKPGWNQDLLRSCNYLGRSCLFRRDRMVEIGGYRTGFTGAEDYDLILRYVQGLASSSVHHVPWIVYHRRVDQASSDQTISHCSGKHALQDYFAQSNTLVQDGPAPQHYRILYPLPATLPLVSIIIPTRNQKNILSACLDSIFAKTSYSNYEILIVDNQTNDPTSLNYLDKIAALPKVRILRYDAPFNYAAINNAAAKQAHGEILALLNNDVEIITQDWLQEMVRHCLRPEIGAVGAKLLYSNNTIQHAGVILGLGGLAGHGHKFLPDNAPGYCHRAVVTQNYSAVTGACLVVRKIVFEEIGGLDEHFAVAFNDIDFCLRLQQQGYRNLFTPYAKLYHHESFSRGKDDSPEKQAIFHHESKRMRKKWGSLLERDPAYNPNLSLIFEGFTLKVQ